MIRSAAPKSQLRPCVSIHHPPNPSHAPAIRSAQLSEGMASSPATCYNSSFKDVDLLIRGSAILQEHLLRQLRLLGLHRRLGARVPASPCAHPTSPFVNSKAAARVQQTPGSLLRHLPCPSSSAVSGGKKRTGKKRKGFELIFIDFRFVFTILSTFFHVYLGVSDL